MIMMRVTSCIYELMKQRMTCMAALITLEKYSMYR